MNKLFFLKNITIKLLLLTIKRLKGYLKIKCISTTAHRASAN